MRVLLVYPDVHTYGGSYYTGVASLAAVLKRRGHQCTLLHVTRSPDRAEVQRIAREYGPGLVAISATSPQFPYARLLAGWIREVARVPVVCGGVHPTLCPEEVVGCEELDLVNVGEGEEPLCELADALEAGRDVSGIRNLWVKTAGGVVRNPPRPLIADLDALPFPDRSVFDQRKFLDRWGGVARITASRGCPYSCTFCSNHAIRAACGGGPAVRVRSPESVVEEIEALRREYHVDKIYFDDDTFTLEAERVSRLCALYGERIGLPFMVNARVETLTRPMLRALRAAGCEQISMGVETGNEWLRTEVLGKRITDAQIVEAFRMAREAGIATCSLNMIGLPCETPAMAEETIRLNEALAPDFLQVAVFYPFPGTELHARCKLEGWLTDRTKSSFFDRGSTLDLPTLSARELRRYRARLEAMSFGRALAAQHRWFLPVFRGLDALFARFDLTAADLFIALRHELVLPLADALSRHTSRFRRITARS
jgi:radical SAM superfamily enzyme YgiQ (UPF0313 family)